MPSIKFSQPRQYYLLPVQISLTDFFKHFNLATGKHRLSNISTYSTNTRPENVMFYEVGAIHKS